MLPTILNSLHIDKSNRLVITQALITQCSKLKLHVLFGVTNLDMDEADAYVVSPSGHQVIPVSIRKRRPHQVLIKNVDEIPKVIKAICREFNNSFVYQ